jgi:hypothetical protein
MRLADRNLLVDLIPKLFERANFENLIKRIGQPDALDEIPGNASFRDAAIFIVDRAIAGLWIGPLVDAIRADFPARIELQGIDAAATDDAAESPAGDDDDRSPPPPPPPVPRWWRRAFVLPAASACVAAVVTVLAIKMWPGEDEPAQNDAGLGAATADAPRRPSPPRPRPADAAVDAPPDARAPRGDGGLLIRPDRIRPDMIRPDMIRVVDPVSRLRAGLTFPIGKCQAASWFGPENDGSLEVIKASCSCATGPNTAAAVIARYASIAELPDRDTVARKLKAIGAACP